MSKTRIEYLTHTWSPIAMRCTPVSEGCAHCWHLKMCDRLAGNLRDLAPFIPMIIEFRKAFFHRFSCFGNICTIKALTGAYTSIFRVLHSQLCMSEFCNQIRYQYLGQKLSSLSTEAA